MILSGFQIVSNAVITMKEALNDEKGFDVAMQEQKARSRSGSEVSKKIGSSCCWICNRNL